MIDDFLVKFRGPMEPLSCSELPLGKDYLYQVKWDGIRIIAILDQGKLRLFNKHLRERSNQYPELHDLPQRIDAQSAVLDGEIVVLRDGKPNFPDVMRRANCIIGEQPGLMQIFYPIEYMLFDLLYLNGQNLMNLPLSERQIHLHNIAAKKDYLHLVENFSDGQVLFKAVRSMDMEGVVAKKNGSPYIQGKKHQSWFKIKSLRRQNCLLGGFTLRGKLVNSLLLGAYRDGALFYIGKAANGLDASSLEVLSLQLPALEISENPFVNISRKSPEMHFVKPELGVEVEFLEWTDDLKLRTPVIKNFAIIGHETCVF
ncbi:MAG: non-homologous end-joining DNA ligase [Syntrophomonas sp.]